MGHPETPQPSTLAKVCGGAASASRTGVGACTGPNPTDIGDLRVFLPRQPAASQPHWSFSGRVSSFAGR
jgi:hypothetical protein